MPVTTRDGDEEIVLAFVIDDDRVGTGAVGDSLVQLLEVVLVLDINRIAVGADAG